MKKNKTTLSNLIENYIQEVKHCLDTLDRKKTKQVVKILMNAYKHKRHIYVIGNGGSASNASHMACDLGKGTLQRVYDDSEPRFRVTSLTDNVALMTAYGNDLAYEDIFVQQLRNLIQRDDVLIVMSASGNSPNILKSVRYAKKCRAKTIGFLGFKTGGSAAKLLDVAIIADSNLYGPCEDMSGILTHIITTAISHRKDDHDKKSAHLGRKDNE